MCTDGGSIRDERERSPVVTKHIVGFCLSFFHLQRTLIRAENAARTAPAFTHFIRHTKGPEPEPNAKTNTGSYSSYPISFSF